MCEQFARANINYIDSEVQKVVQSIGRIILSLNNTQPEKGELAI
ncbi:MAG: hypothetical protein ACTSXP_07295 [Promethearchaeota archaeon]